MTIFVEILTLLSRSNTTKGGDLKAYQRLIMNDMKDSTSKIISDLAANLLSLHNESNDNKVTVRNAKSHLSKEEETCPNYDNISQKDIDFNRVRLFRLYY